MNYEYEAPVFKTDIQDFSHLTLSNFRRKDQKCYQWYGRRFRCVGESRCEVAKILYEGSSYVRQRNVYGITVSLKADVSSFAGDWRPSKRSWTLDTSQGFRLDFAADLPLIGSFNYN